MCVWVNLCNVHLPVFPVGIAVFLVVDLVSRLIGVSVTLFTPGSGTLFLAPGGIVVERWMGEVTGGRRKIAKRVLLLTLHPLAFNRRPVTTMSAIHCTGCN